MSVEAINSLEEFKSVVRPVIFVRDARSLIDIIDQLGPSHHC